MSHQTTSEVDEVAPAYRLEIKGLYDLTDTIVDELHLPYPEDQGGHSFKHTPHSLILALRDKVKALTAQPSEVDRLKDELAALDLKWAAASAFIRDIVDACALPQPAEDAVVDLPELVMQVIGQIEEGKLASQSAPSGWQPIETLADCDRLVWLWTPPHRLSDRLDQEPDMRVSTHRDWTWATIWQPCPMPLPPGQNAVDALPPAPEVKPKASECVCGHQLCYHTRANLGKCEQCDCKGYVDGPASYELGLMPKAPAPEVKDAIPPEPEGAIAKPVHRRGHLNTCDLVGFRQGYNAPGVCSCGFEASQERTVKRER